MGMGIGLGAGGLVVGFIIGMVVGKGGKGRLEQELSDAQDEVARMKSQAKKLEMSKSDLDKQRKRAEELGKELDQYREQMQKISGALQEAEAARDRANQQLTGHQSARQQAESRLKQVEKSIGDQREKLEAAQGHLKNLQQEHDSLRQTAERRGEEIKRLRRSAAGGSEGVEETVTAFAAAEGRLNQVLGVLVEKEGQNLAVLADANGIVVAAAGDKDLRDGVAAAAQYCGTALVKQFDGMVPFESIEAFSFEDSNSTVLAGRSFDAAGERIALATYGARRPNDQVLHSALESLTEALA